MRSQRFDSLIFDMDGTLWDAVDSYCEVWNVTHREMGIAHTPVVRDQLISLMGHTLSQIIDIITPSQADNEDFFRRLADNEHKLMPVLGGRLYAGVAEIIPKLARDFRLFMVSNCSASGLPNFLHYTGLEPYFADTLSNGQTGLSKGDNIARIIDKHQLRAPLYIGDTAGDAAASRCAGIPFAWTAYGFGHVDNPDFTLQKFDDINNIVWQNRNL